MIKSYGVIFDRYKYLFHLLVKLPEILAQMYHDNDVKICAFRIIITFDVGTSIALAAWIPGIMTTLALATAPITSALCQKYNCRYVTAVGAILSATGIISSSFAGTIQVSIHLI